MEEVMKERGWQGMGRGVGLLAASLVLVVGTGCSDDDDPVTPNPPGVQEPPLGDQLGVDEELSLRA